MLWILERPLSKGRAKINNIGERLTTYDSYKQWREKRVQIENLKHKRSLLAQNLVVKGKS